MSSRTRCTKTTVSVILPTFNRARTLRRAIDSVLMQNYPDFELLVIDNGSTDHTRSIVHGISDSRVFYFAFSEKQGPGAARNYGLARAVGRYIAFLDSDDEWLPGKLKQQIYLLENSDAETGLVYTDMWWISLQGKRVYHRSPRVTPGRLLDAEQRFYQVYNLGIQSILAKRECMDVAGNFREDLSCFEDMEFLIRFSKRYKCHHIPRPLVNYIESQGSISKQRDEELTVRAQLLRIFSDDIRRHRAFYYKEKLIVFVCRQFEVSDYFSKSNQGCRHTLFQWLKRPDSPYVLGFKKRWVRLADRYLAGCLARFGARLYSDESLSSVNALIVLAPPRENRLEKAIELYKTTSACKLLVFKYGRDRLFGPTLKFSLKKRVVQLLKTGELEFVSHPAGARPSTFTEIKEIRDALISLYAPVAIVTDGFHSGRTRLTVDFLLRDYAERVVVVAADSGDFRRDNWWHTLSGVRTCAGEWLKQAYYRHCLMRESLRTPARES